VFCDRLKLGLGSARHDVSWVNILKDSEAAEYVARLCDGVETVPTAVTGAGVVIEATPAAIKAQLDRCRS
jgi:mycoredoxin